MRVLNVREPVTVMELARELRVTPEALMSANPSFTTATRRLQVGTAVVLPAESQVGAAPSPRRHQWEEGESLTVVARRFAVSEDELLRANPALQRGAAPVGSAIVVPPPRDSGWMKPQQATVYRVVSSGDTLHSIAHRTGYSVEELTAANDGMEPHRPLAQQHAVFLPPRQAIRPVYDSEVYRVTPGDSLASIAHRYGVTVESIQDANPSIRAASDIRPGREIVVPAVARGDRVPTQITVEAAEPVDQFARRNNTTVEVVLQHNPEVSRGGRVSAGQVVVLPPPTRNFWQDNQQPQQRTVTHYTVAGETVDSIAHRYGVPPEVVRRGNPNLPPTGSLPEGRRIVVVDDAAAGEQRAQSYGYVVPGESPLPVHHIAAIHGISSEDLRKHNGWDATVADLPPGTRVAVPPPPREAHEEVWAAEGRRAVTHRVAAGDSIATIAYRYGVSEEQLRQQNPTIRAGAIRSGLELVVVEPEQRASPGTKHLVKANESVSDIARAYGVSEQVLRAANPSHRFRPFDIITVPTSSYDQRYTTYETNPAESSRDVAARYGVEEQDLLAANPGTVFGTGRRQPIVIPSSSADVATRDRARFEEVYVAPSSAADTPQQFAHRYGLNPDQLTRSNMTVDLSSKMPARVILPDVGVEAYRSPPPLPKYTAAHVSTVDAYEPQHDETITSVARRFQLPEEAVAALNPNFNPGRTVLLPAGALARQPASPAVGQEGMRRASAAESALANRDTILDRYERDLVELQSGRLSDARQTASQMEHLLREYQRVADELYRCAAANREWEAQCAALQSAMAGGGNEADLRRELVRTTSELHQARSHFAEHERQVRADAEREFTRRARMLERAHREDSERLKTELEHQLANYDADAMDRSLATQPVQNAAGFSVDSAGGFKGASLGDLEPFLRYKEDSYSQLVRDYKHLEEQHALVNTRCATLTEKFDTMAFAIDSRPALLRIIFDLHKLADASSGALEDLALRLSVRELQRRVVQQDLASIAADVRDLARSHHWIIGNLFTEVEVMHLGASPAAFQDTVDRKLLQEAPKVNPAAPTPRRVGTSPARGRSSTPVRLTRTTTTTTTTTLSKLPRSTARGF
jgi:LysM repeat protein